MSDVKYYLSCKNNNNSLKETCKIFNCKKSPLARWTKRYFLTGNVDNKQRKEGSYKIKKKLGEYISKLIKEKSDIFL